LIYSQSHPWLAEMRTDACFAQLAAVEARFAGAGRTFVGHGPAGGRELFGQQREYILWFRDLVARSAHGGTLSAAAVAAIRQEALAKHPTWPLDGLIETNATAIARELARVPATKPGASRH
jgi:hypothetical protein